MHRSAEQVLDETRALDPRRVHAVPSTFFFFFITLKQLLYMMCSGSEAGSYLRLIDFVSLNSRLETRALDPRRVHAVLLYFLITLKPSVE